MKSKWKLAHAWCILRQTENCLCLNMQRYWRIAGCMQAIDKRDADITILLNVISHGPNNY